jgi:hypothetical protein
VTVLFLEVLQTLKVSFPRSPIGRSCFGCLLDRPRVDVRPWRGSVHPWWGRPIRVWVRVRMCIQPWRGRPIRVRVRVWVQPWSRPHTSCEVYFDSEIINECGCIFLLLNISCRYQYLSRWKLTEKVSPCAVYKYNGLGGISTNVSFDTCGSILPAVCYFFACAFAFLKRLFETRVSHRCAVTLSRFL